MSRICSLLVRSYIGKKLCLLQTEHGQNCIVLKLKSIRKGDHDMKSVNSCVTELKILIFFRQIVTVLLF